MTARAARYLPWFLKPVPGRKPWSRWTVLNIASAAAIVWALFWLTIGSHWHLGLDPQDLRCLPWRLYVVSQHTPAQLVKGDIYMYRSEHVGTIMPDGMPVAKFLAAVAGDRVVVDRNGVSVNGKYWGAVNPDVIARAELDPTRVYADYVVPAGRALVLGTLPHSFDGRYWGTIATDQIIARAYPVW